MSQLESFAGKLAVVTGGGSGMGRELVRQLAAQGCSVAACDWHPDANQAIAGQLVVTLDTVKKHVSHLLGKLGAANRTEAVSRARELSLIP